MIHKLVFDISDANTIADSSNVGAYLRSSDGTLITHSTDGSREALDVFTELGLAEDSAHTSGDIGVQSLAVRNDTAGSLVDADGDYAPLQVDADGNLRVSGTFSEEDVYAEDSPFTSGDDGGFVLAVRNDGGGSLVDTDGDFAPFQVNADGELFVADPDARASLSSIESDASTIAADTTSIDGLITALSKAEDSAHVSGDQGIQSLAVRNDTLGSLADTDGDYAPLQVNSDGALYVDVSNAEVTVSDAALADTAIASAANALDAANTAEDVVASPLSNRKYLMVYNNGNREIYVGASGVSATDGFPIPPGAMLNMRAGASIDIEWVGPNTNQEIRTLELS